MKGQTFLRRLGFAVDGLKAAFRREHSFRQHLLATGAVLGVLLVTRPAPVWWAIGAITVGLVLMAELFNSALEALIDHLHPERHPEIRVVKDIAAGAVLVTSLIALAVAVAFVFR
ncbi:hypothetical protein GCM10025771_09790 [Niveibacterium umoris]|uniref:Diacylglycerol kinase (ATP) n=1 Tax=Niveibacterium umoris TaxID=1193620 RepID=A0A840BP72_9RHOO|nr:diacylglycerol kinase [Niveibacterium umoris]MBB4013472.1 diacylglycerol kinase (ATP) [Niveibacterium umoris]